MTPVPWKLWEGQVVDFCLPLRRYIGGTQQSAVFLTQFGDPEPRNAAIKLVLASPRDPELTAQWDHAAQLSHPNLMGVLKRGTCQVNQLSLHYLVTEYAEMDLAEVLGERALTAGEVSDMLEPLLDALSYIHAQGFVHGHVKPANIMAVDDQLKLSVDGITTVGELEFTPITPGPYDPPEMAERGRSPIGDVWSFGMTLVEALTRQLPQLAGPKQEPVLPVGLPEQFLPMVRACLRPDPRKRATLDEINSRFRNAAVPSHAIEEDAPAEVEAATPSNRKWLRAALVGATAVALAAALAGSRILRTPSSQAASNNVVQAKPEVAKGGLTPVVQSTKPSPLPVESAPVKASEAAIPERTVPAEAAAPAPVVPERARKAQAKPGEIINQVMPELMDRDYRSIHGKFGIDVIAAVDATGHVKSAKPQAQKSKYFTRLTLKAVEQWTFQPKEGNWMLHFEFTNRGTQVTASQLE